MVFVVALLFGHAGMRAPRGKADPANALKSLYTPDYLTLKKLNPGPV